MTSKSLTDQAIHEYLRALDCPRALTVHILYFSGEHQQLVDLEFEPQIYNCLKDARDALAATKFLSKATFLSLNIDREKVALEKALDAENSCRTANNRIISNCLSATALTVLQRAAYLVSKILGDFDGDELVDASDWGPGATIQLPRRRATRTMKFHVERGISPKAHDFVTSWFNAAYPLWDISSIESTDFNKIVTVPKTSKTDRTIAIEPGLNLWFQKGIGKMIRRRLKAFGIDLSDQTFNQKRARLGSVTNDLATVDFSAASDTIAIELVKELLPPRWLALLACFRSSFGQHKSIGRIKYEKWSSMGNGYTFELETLIFYTIAIACTERCNSFKSVKGISVYGDDVILPCNSVEMYASVMAEFGLSVNKSKSYSSTYYRESCGSHYWFGVDIKPIFLKEPLDGKETILRFANSVRRLARRRNNYGCDRALRRCWLVLASVANAPVVSEGFGDCGLIGNFDEAAKSPRPPVRAKHGIEGFYVRAYVTISVKKEFYGHGLLLDRLTSIGGDLSYGNTLVQNGRTKCALKRILVPRWDEMGPWI